MEKNKIPLLTETWEQLQKPSPAKPREGVGSALEYFKLRTDFVLMYFHDNLEGTTRRAKGVK